jgi:hypothetical protein
MGGVTEPTGDVGALHDLVPVPVLGRAALQALVAPGPAGGGGWFEIDPESAQECVRMLREVVVDLVEAQLLMDQAYFTPPGWDDVSRNAAEQAAVMTDRARQFVLTWRTQLQQTAEGLERQLADYRAAEAANRERFA